MSFWGVDMNNILQFPKRNISTITIDIQTTILEDVSIWYRLTDIKNGGWWEWIKLEED
jgi:hypothetical protein